MKKPELLAPAGDYQKMKWAFLYGADAVYLSGKNFGLRANAPNFSVPEIRRAVNYAHKRGKKIYVTVNIVLHNKEAIKILKYLKKLKELNVDAIIASDLYVIENAKKINIKVFVSTQASIMNHQAVKFLEKMQVDRIILARELSKKNLTEIRQKTNIELETFIHGAMCAGISGRCVLSNYLTNRDANRGGCSQVCRWQFVLYQNQRKITDQFSFAVKDLIMASYIKELMLIGIDSFKIEGRMRSLYYIATVVSVYRRIIDGYFADENYQIAEKDYQILYKVANRESIDQFFKTKCNPNYHYYDQKTEISNQDFLGIVLSYDKKNKLAFIEQRNYFKKNDKVEVFNDKEIISVTIKEIYDEEMNQIALVKHPKQKVFLKLNKVVKKNDIIRKTI